MAYDLLAVAATVCTLLEVGHQTLVQVFTLFNTFLDALLAPIDSGLPLHADLLLGENCFLCKQFCIFSHTFLHTPNEVRESSDLRRHSYGTLYSKIAQVICRSHTLEDEFVAHFSRAELPRKEVLFPYTPDFLKVLNTPVTFLKYVERATSDDVFEAWLDAHLDHLCRWVHSWADKALAQPFGHATHALLVFLYLFAARAPDTAAILVFELSIRYLYDKLTSRDDALLFVFFVRLTEALLVHAHRHRFGIPMLLTVFSENHILPYFHNGLDRHPPHDAVAALLTAVVAFKREDLLKHFLCDENASPERPETASLWAETATITSEMFLPPIDTCGSTCSCRVEKALLENVRQFVFEMTLEEASYADLVRRYVARSSATFSRSPTVKLRLSPAKPLPKYLLLLLPTVIFSPHCDTPLEALRKVVMSLMAPMDLNEGPTVVFEMGVFSLFVSALFLDKSSLRTLDPAPAIFRMDGSSPFPMKSRVRGLLGPTQVFLIKMYGTLVLRNAKDFYCTLPPSFPSGSSQ